VERICQNCKLFNESEGTCLVTIIVRGEHYELPVIASDSCHWERVDREIQSDLEHTLSDNKEPYFRAKLESEMDSVIEVKQMRMWSDGKNGYIETTE